MSTTPYARHLDKTAANYQPLTPLTFLERAAVTYPKHLAVVHGPLRLSYAELYGRARRLASALAARGMGVVGTKTEIWSRPRMSATSCSGVPVTSATVHAPWCG